VLVLENLEPAQRVTSPQDFRPGITFDGATGTATTPGYVGEPENFDEFLLDAGMNPAEVDVIPPVRTSRWQRYDGEWLTSYRFTFRRKTSGIDLPLLMAEGKRKSKPTPLAKPEPRCLVVMWSDLQVGKVDYRGNSQSLIERVELMQARLVEQVKREKPERIVFADLGDTVENFSNAAPMHQLQSNDLSIMEQVDLATTFAWQTLKLLSKYVPNITYASVGSNHCQWRIGREAVGKPTDDWGVFIGRQLARLAQESDLPIQFVEPQPHDESLALDVFGDGFHILGIVHGHQAKRPDMVATWWRQQAFGAQPVSAANILIHGHWHHLRVTELGSTPRGTSRFLIMAPTMDNGSGWWRRIAGEDSVPGLATFMLEQGVDFTGTVYKH
jgi:hypothetical protein